MPKLETRFSDEQLQFLLGNGISGDEASRQYALLERGVRGVVLERPCTVGDGIEQLPSNVWGKLTSAHERAADLGRWLKFVPASGAASRLFAFHSQDDRARFARHFDDFAFAPAAREQLAARGMDPDALIREHRWNELIDALVSSEGLALGQLPKGLLPFHAYSGKCRTALEEHLQEAVACFRDRDGIARGHFTIAADARRAFVDLLTRFQRETADTSFEIDFSIQAPHTDTIALGEDGELLQNNGRPILRPGGHGALLENLHQRNGDLIFVKNIDNVLRDEDRELSLSWMRRIGGYTVRVQEAIHQHLRSIDTGTEEAVAAAANFVELTFPHESLPHEGDVAELRDAVTACLRRPLRVCGMVPNAGEPGGGPFWVRGADGKVTPQIVEAAEINHEDELQAAIARRATHFNPVFMALSLRDERGIPFALPHFADAERAIVTRKQVAGQAAIVLEHPGLWNGAMAGWNSVFVEVPSAVFSPVKSVFDLLRKGHCVASHGVSLPKPPVASPR